MVVENFLKQVTSICMSLVTCFTLSKVASGQARAERCKWQWVQPSNMFLCFSVLLPEASSWASVPRCFPMGSIVFSCCCRRAFSLSNALSWHDLGLLGDLCPWVCCPALTLVSGAEAVASLGLHTHEAGWPWCRLQDQHRCGKFWVCDSVMVSGVVTGHLGASIWVRWIS